MPMHEYKCQECGEIIEHWDPFNDVVIIVCDHCGGIAEKIISLCSFKLKGEWPGKTIKDKK